MINKDISLLRKETEELKAYINISLIAKAEGTVTMPAVSMKTESTIYDEHILQNGFLAAA